jgi:uncharacterized protein YceK
MTKSSLLKSTLLSIAVFTLLSSCTTPRTTDDPTDKVWYKGRYISERKMDRKLNRYTKSYVRNLPDSVVAELSQLNIQ